MSLENLLNTIYLTFAHNEYAIAFFIGALLSVISLIYKPSRSKVLLLIAFTTLLIGFEYEKHIMEPLMDQTLNSLGVNEGGSRSGSLLAKIFKILLPFGFFTVGWGLLFGVLFTKNINLKPKPTSPTTD